MVSTFTEVMKDGQYIACPICKCLCAIVFRAEPAPMGGIRHELGQSVMPETPLSHQRPMSEFNHQVAFEIIVRAFCEKLSQIQIHTYSCLVLFAP
jgi:hypothetical protein